MDKKEIAIKIIEFLKSFSRRSMVINSDHNLGMPKLILNILVKEFSTPFNIAFIAPSDVYFKEIFPKVKDNILTKTSYNIGPHKISFYLFDKALMKSPPKDVDMVIAYPIDSMKDKDLVKVLESMKTLKKTFLIATAMEEPTKVIKKYSKEFITLKPAQDTAYYNTMKQKLFDIK